MRRASGETQLEKSVLSRSCPFFAEVFQWFPIPDSPWIQLIWNFARKHPPEQCRIPCVSTAVWHATQLWVPTQLKNIFLDHWMGQWVTKRLPCTANWTFAMDAHWRILVWLVMETLSEPEWTHILTVYGLSLWQITGCLIWGSDKLNLVRKCCFFDKLITQLSNFCMWTTCRLLMPVSGRMMYIDILMCHHHFGQPLVQWLGLVFGLPFFGPCRESRRPLTSTIASLQLVATSGRSISRLVGDIKLKGSTPPGTYMKVSPTTLSEGRWIHRGDDIKWTAAHTIFDQTHHFAWGFTGWSPPNGWRKNLDNIYIHIHILL